MSRSAISAWEGSALVALSFVALSTVGTQLAGHGLGGTALGEIVCVLLPALAFIAARRVSAAELGLARVSPLRLALGIAGGVLLGLALFYVSAALVEPAVERVLPPPPALRRALERMVVPAAGPRPLALDLVGFALVPAVAEELLFRGLLFAALAGRLRALLPRARVTADAVTVVVTALAFGLYHGSPYRFVPALTGGLVLGFARAASGRSRRRSRSTSPTTSPSSSSCTTAAPSRPSPRCRSRPRPPRRSPVARSW